MLRAPAELVVDEVELGQPGDGELLIAVERCGICATDLAAWARGRPQTPASPDTRLPHG